VPDAPGTVYELQLPVFDLATVIADKIQNVSPADSITRPKYTQGTKGDDVVWRVPIVEGRRPTRKADMWQRTLDRYLSYSVVKLAPISVKDTDKPPASMQDIVSETRYHSHGDYSVVHRITINSVIVDQQLVFVTTSRDHFPAILRYLAQYYSRLSIADYRTYNNFVNSVPSTEKRQIQRANVLPITTFNPETDPRYWGLKLDGTMCYVYLRGLKDNWVEVYVYAWGRKGLWLIDRVKSTRAVPHAVIVCEHMHAGTHKEYFYAFDMIHLNKKKRRKGDKAKPVIVDPSAPVAPRDVGDLDKKDLKTRRDALLYYMQTYMVSAGTWDEADVYYLGDYVQFQRRPFHKVSKTNPVADLRNASIWATRVAEKNDGIILTGLSTYETLIQSAAGNTSKDYLMKLKKEVDTTSDLWYRRKPNKRNGAFYYWYNRSYVQYDPESTMHLPVLDQLYDGHIVELKVVPLTDNDTALLTNGYTHKALLVGVRTDKGTTPNAQRTVLSNMLAATNTDQLSRVFGLTTQRVFRMSRAIMTHLNNISRGDHVTYVEIGIGRFGSRSTYKSTDRVLGVEMSGTLIAEGKKRMTGMNNMCFLQAKVEWNHPGTFTNALNGMPDPDKAKVFGRTRKGAEPAMHKRLIVVNLYNMLTFLPDTHEAYVGFFDQLFIAFGGNQGLVRINILDFDLNKMSHLAQWTGLGINILRPGRNNSYTFKFPSHGIVGTQTGAHLCNFKRIADFEALVSRPIDLSELMTSGELKGVTPYIDLYPKEREYLGFQSATRLTFNDEF
jgi:hypothetical protein